VHGNYLEVNIVADAKPRVVDFRDAELSPEEDARPTNSKGKLLTGKQVRARARRVLEKGKKLSDEDFEAWAGKPIDEWDLEELSRGRPRNASGDFRGRPPQYMPRAVHERIAERFKALTREKMNQHSVAALGVVGNLLTNDEVDDKGKPIVSPSVKLDAAKWLVEHVVGKPVQPTQTDVSVKLQGILGVAMVNPVLDDNHPDMKMLPRGYSLAHIGSRGDEVIDLEPEDDDDDDY
jgi:hypothetical protein